MEEPGISGLDKNLVDLVTDKPAELAALNQRFPTLGSAWIMEIIRKHGPSREKVEAALAKASA